MRGWGFVYQSPWHYELTMRLSRFTRHTQVYTAVTTLLDSGSVLDLCSGPGILTNYLKGQRYTGIDLNPVFCGSPFIQQGDIETGLWPDCDQIVMVDSLYHFGPDCHSLIQKMVQSAHRRVVISEPVDNWSSSRWRWKQIIANWATVVDGRTYTFRFQEDPLRRLLQKNGFQNIHRIGANLMGVYEHV